MGRRPTMGLKRGERPGPDPERRREALLGRLSEPGCVLCRDDVHQTRRYWFWFANESYGEPPTIAALRSSNGFCPRHMRHLMVLGSPRLVTAVQSHVIDAAIERARAALATARKGASPRDIARPLSSPAPCPACASVGEHRRREEDLLAEIVSDAGIRDQLIAGRALCWKHWRNLAGGMSWDRLRSLTETMAVVVESARPTGEGPGLRTSWATLQGEDVDRFARRAAVEGDRNEPTEVEAWSPTVGWLRRWLALPACPLCRGRRAALTEFLTWLDREVHEPPNRWRNALGLCPVHAWDFATRASSDSWQTLAAGLWRECSQALGWLRDQLGPEPPRSVRRRLSEAPQHLREGLHATGHRHPRPRHLAAALLAALEAPESRLRRLLARLPLDRVCPACEALQTRTHRLTDLLVRALRDPETARAYRTGIGVCVRHLPALVTACRTGREAAWLLEVELDRLEVLQWELEEALRKENWSVRHEARGGEQSAWRRACEQLAGCGTLEQPSIGV